jgi:transposase-like protein
MARRPRRARNPLFAKRWFSDDIIVRCVRWYLRYKLSYRDLAELMGELGTSVAPSTILRWVVRYSAGFAQYWRCYKKPVGRSWRCDETYIKVGGRWMYLYQAVDERGSTVESHLSRTRDVAAAKAFFRKGTEASLPPAHDHAGRLRADALRLTPHGHAKRVQLPVGKPGQDSFLSIPQ